MAERRRRGPAVDGEVGDRDSGDASAAPAALEVDRLAEIADDLRVAAARLGTPVFVTDEATIDAAADELAAAFPDPWIRQYSVKANDVPAIVALVTKRGRIGANVVSRGEWAAARAGGVPNDRITLEGIGKTDADLAAAVRAAARGDPLAWLAVESADELEVLVERAARARLGRDGRPALDVLLRLNPDVAPETHASLAVGRGTSKFGMTETELGTAAEVALAGGPGVRPRGVHLHVGSQLGAVDAWRDGVRRALAVTALLRGSIESFDTVDLGGGFPVPPVGQPGPRPGRFARELPPIVDAIPAERRPRRLAVEPGRFLVARGGWLVARVLHVRERSGPQVVLDTGMTELLRPALYGAIHGVVALTSAGAPIADATGSVVHTASVADVHGPICESTDVLGEHPLPPLRRGDLVAIREAGAYAASQSSTYNGRARAAQAIRTVEGRIVVARRRGAATSLAAR